MYNIITITIYLYGYPLRLLQFATISLGRERARIKVLDGFPTSLHAHELSHHCGYIMHIRFTKLQPNKTKLQLYIVNVTAVVSLDFSLIVSIDL